LPQQIDSGFVVAEIVLPTIQELTMNVFRPMAVITLAASVLTGAARAQDVLRIGAPLPLTGALAPEGAKLKQGYELWQDKVNAAGGVKAGDKRLKVDLVYYDYQSTTPKAVQLAKN
jgi:branched-chain amino acid transport system substrate-binding protein